jgi:hypothetical protein
VIASQIRLKQLQVLLDCVNQFINCNVISPQTRNQSQRLKLILEKEIAVLQADRTQAA